MDGHAMLASDLVCRRANTEKTQRVPMRLEGNDRWTGTFVPPTPGRYQYSIEAWSDVFGTWRRDVVAKQKAGVDISLEIEEGRQMLANLGQAKSCVGPSLLPELLQERDA